MASTEIRDRRRSLRCRSLLVRQMVQMKNRVSGLLMETGVSHNKQRLHKVGYFRELLATNPEVPDSIRLLLKLSRETISGFQDIRALKDERNGSNEGGWMYNRWRLGSQYGNPGKEQKHV